MKILITQSLLSSWLYQYKAPEDFEEEARESFLRTLRKEETEPTEAMLNGIRFENGVYALANNPESLESFPAWLQGTRRIAEIIRGGQIQVKVKREISVDGDEYLLYGVLDALKAGTIYDVKFSNTKFGSAEMAGKYLESPQHPAYLYMVPEAYRFIYLCSDGESLYTEEYTRKQTPDIGGIIRDFRRYIRETGLEEALREKWTAR